MENEFKKENFEGVVLEESTLLTPIAALMPQELRLKEAEGELPLAPVTATEALKAKRYYLGIANGFAPNGIRQHGIGFGKYFPLKNNFGVDVQLGGSLNLGYSFSQDSVTIINGLSIIEERRDKDLVHTWNAYLNVGAFYQKGNWRFGLGLKSTYALLNQFYFVENTKITHIGTFDASIGETIQRYDRGDWTGLNRMGFKGYLNVNCHINANYSIGFFAEKRFNPLILQDMAQQAYSNIPVEFGVVLNKHF